MVIIVSTILFLNRILSSLSQLAREITMQTPCHALYVYQSNFFSVMFVNVIQPYTTFKFIKLIFVEFSIKLYVISRLNYKLYPVI